MNPQKKAAAFLLALCAGPLLMRATCGAEGPPKVDANDAGAVKALISDLGNPEYAAREKAQAALETVPYAQIETLRKYAAAVADPEAKARLDAAIDRVEEIGIMTEPPISAEINDATASRVAAALSKAIGAPLPPTDRDDAARTFTLHAKEQPFSEIVRQLSGQHPLFAPSGAPETAQYVQSTRGAAIIITQPTQTGMGITFQVASVLDPRIKVLDLGDPEIKDVHDELGNVFDLVPNSGEALLRARLAAQLNVGGGPATSTQGPPFRAFRFEGKGAPGKAVTIRGTVTCVVAVSETKSEIADAGKHVGEAIPLGDSKVTLRDVSPAADATTRAGLQLEIVPNDSKIAPPPAPNVKFTATGISLSGGLSAGGGTRLVIDSEGNSGGMMIGAGGPSMGATHITVTDATGKTVANYSVPRGAPVTSIHAVAGDFKEPLKFTFTYPTKTREVTIPFEFKDLPIK